MTSAQPLPSARQVYDVLERALEPECTTLGLQRVPKVKYPAWRSTVDGETVFVSLQVDSKATDPYSGGGFRVELERSRDRAPARGLNGRAHFFQLLTPAELQPLLQRQECVVRSLPRPPREQIEAYPAGQVREMYLSYFEPQQDFTPVRSWLRFRTGDDVFGWADELKPLLGPLVSRAAQLLSPDVRALGSGPLI